MNKPTETQRKARTRNWHLKQLRAYFHLCPPPVSPSARKTIRQIIDGEILRLGGESEIKRQEELRKDLEVI